MGRYPIGAIGFGKASEYSRIRMPKPPQNNTTFTIFSPACEALSSLKTNCGSAAASDFFLQPDLAAKMAILLGAQLVRKSARRQFYVVVCEDGVLGNVALELAAFDQSLRQVAAVTHLDRVHGLAIGHEHSVIVEYLARFQIAFGNRTNLNHWPTQRSGD